MVEFGRKEEQRNDGYMLDEMKGVSKVWEEECEWEQKSRRDKKETFLCSQSGVWPQLLNESNGSVAKNAEYFGLFVDLLAFTCFLPRWCRISTYFAFFFPLSSTSCFVRTLVNLCNPALSNSCSHWGLSILPQGRSGDHFLWLVFVWMISRTHASFCIFELGSWRVT